MNVILLFLLIAEACIGLCCWLSPEALRRLAAHLLTRADVIEVARREQSRRLRYWQVELRLERTVSEGTTSTIAVVQSLPDHLSRLSRYRGK
jgi:hypothetical protein